MMLLRLQGLFLILLLTNISSESNLPIYSYSTLLEKVSDSFSHSRCVVNHESARTQRGKVAGFINGNVLVKSDNVDVNISSIPPSEDIISMWKKIKRPTQHRVEPLLCELPYTRKRPIFNANGQLQI
jgi:hypothetical protein